MNHLMLVAIGGGVGASCRYLTGNLTLRLFGPNYPWGTFAVNILGSAVIGLLVELIARRFNASNELRLLLVTGFLGGFTTFSSFSLDAVNMMERGQMGLAAIYIVSSVTLSIGALFAGLALVRAFG